jgi:hypothetical protein
VILQKKVQGQLSLNVVVCRLTERHPKPLARGAQAGVWRVLLECQRAHIFEGEDTEAKGFGFQHARRRRESPEVSGVDVANNQLEGQRTHFACALLFTVCADAVLLSSGRDAPHVILQKKKPANVLAVAARANP